MAEKLFESDYYTEPDIMELREPETCEQNRTVFIKGDVRNGKYLWGIYDTEGNRIAMTDNRDFAFVAARQNDFIPYSVH